MGDCHLDIFAILFIAVRLKAFPLHFKSDQIVSLNFLPIIFHEHLNQLQWLQTLDFNYSLGFDNLFNMPFDNLFNFISTTDMALHSKSILLNRCLKLLLDPCFPQFLLKGLHLLFFLQNSHKLRTQFGATDQMEASL